MIIKTESVEHHFKQSPDSTEPLLPLKTNTTKRKKVVKVKTEKKARSRLGCEQCKARRLKCDEQKPHCSRCIEKKINCNYKITLQFREDLEEKGRKFGREGVWSKKEKNTSGNDTSTQLVQKSQESHYQALKHKDVRFINMFVRDLFEQKSTRILPTLKSSVIPVDIISSLDGDISSLSFALNYYVSFISPILNPMGNETKYFNHVSKNENKYIVIENGLDLSALLQYSQGENHLFYLILSLGSIYLSKLTDDPSSKREWFGRSKNFQNLALNCIGGTDWAASPDSSNGSVSSSSSSTSSLSQNHRTDSLLSFVLLILYELANDCNNQWAVYLKLCKELIDCDDFIVPHNSLEYSLLKFGVEFLEYQEAIGRTACKDTNSFFLKYDEEEVSDVETRIQASSTQIKLVSWMGCDKNLLSILQDITDLSFERYNEDANEQNYLELCNRISRRIEALNSNVLDKLIEIADIPETDSYTSFVDSQIELLTNDMDTEEYCFILSCELKRLATIIYFECCLLNKTPQDRYIQRYVRVIFKVLEILVLKNEFKWYSTLIWTVYIASSEISHLSTDCEELRFLSLKILEKIEVGSLGNVNKTREVILRIWKKRDLEGADETSYGYIKNSSNKQPGQKNGKILGFVNDWDRFVVDKDCGLSMG